MAGSEEDDRGSDLLSEEEEDSDLASRSVTRRLMA